MGQSVQIPISEAKLLEAKTEQEQVIEFFADSTSGIFVDVGTNHPIYYNQSYELERLGWRGVLVEPQPQLAKLIRSKRKANFYNVACGSDADSGKQLELYLAGGHSTLLPNEVTPEDTYQEEVTVPILSLNKILSAENITNIDFLSIDVEGFELAVLQGLDLKKHQPKLILLEDHVYNLKLHRYMRRHNYKLIKRTILNNWYVPKNFNYKVSLTTHFKLFRKMYIGTPLRWLKHKVKDSDS